MRWLACVAIFVASCLAQRPMPLGNALPPIHPIPPFGVTSPRPALPARPLRFAGDGLPAVAIYGGADDQSPPASNVIIIQQFGSTEQSREETAPPRLVMSEIREHKSPAEPRPASSVPPSFSIILRDGTAQSALAV